MSSYSDTQRYRLGVNPAQILVNEARCPVQSYHRDKAVRVDRVNAHGHEPGRRPFDQGVR
jgi:catalase